jgi:hypothetical protein
MKAEQNPERFYNYASLRGDDRKSWVRVTVVARTVYFRSRAQLNDPNELRPQFTMEGTEQELRSHAKYLMLHYYKGRKLSPAQRLLKEAQLVRNMRHGTDGAEGSLHDLLSKVGIFCVSESATVPLMWAHYADGHRGICMEFDTASGLFLEAQRVVYSSEAPVVNRIRDSMGQMLDKSMFWKHIDWSYEREWRVIARWDDPLRIEAYKRQHLVSEGATGFINSQHGPGDYAIPHGTLKAIVLGSQICAEDEAWVRKVVAESGDPVQIKRAVVARTGEVTIANAS